MARKKDKKKDSEMGWDAEDADEAKEAEVLKGTQLDEGRVEYHDDDGVIETYDEETGQMEGAIVLKDGNEEGLLAIVKIVEQVKVDQDHDALIENMDFSGKLEVENPSDVDRLWDIDLTLENIESTNLESGEIHIRELGVTDEDRVHSQEFTISGEAKSLLIIKEYINTLPNADDILNINDIDSHLATIQGGVAEKVVDDSDDEVTYDDDDEDYDGAAAEDASMESYGISIDVENTVTFAIAMRSQFENPIKDVKIVKNIPAEFSNTIIKDTTVGMAELEGDQIVWTVDELEPESTALLKFTADILVNTIDPVRTGTIEVMYIASSSFTAMDISKFDAYTRNRFYVDVLERDEEPGVWDCKLVFENSSEFILELFNADVYAPEDESTKLIDIDPNDVPKLPSLAQWHSVGWVYETEDYPEFRKKLEFRVVPDFQTIVDGTINIGDVELSVASMIGDVHYAAVEEPEIPGEIEESLEGEEEATVVIVPTYKEKDVWAILRVQNNGSAPLNDLTVKQQYFTDVFVAPSPEEISLKIDGADVELTEDAISLEENVLSISLLDLRSSDTGEIQPDSMLVFKYPIHCMDPPRDAEFDSEVTYTANTYPLSQELLYTPEVPVIKSSHIRRKFRIGKEVLPIGALGQYQIILSIENVGEMPLQNLTVMDKVPDNFEYGEYSQEPEITDEVGSDTLKWQLEELTEGERLEISYEITGTGEYNPSEAQLAL
jgi:hypothetical protein